MRKIWEIMFGRSILLGLAFALFVITTIGVGGIATSVFVAEQVQGSGSAINVAGSLRMQSHRMGSMVLSDAENDTVEHRYLLAAIDRFELSLANEALLRAVGRPPDGALARRYQAVRLAWLEQLKPLLMEEALPGNDLHPVARHNHLLRTIDAFVDDIDTMVAQLEADTERRIRHLRNILGAALILTLVAVLGVMAGVHRGVLRPLADLLANARRIARGDFSARARHVGRDELGQLGQAFNFMAEDLSKLYRGLELRVAEKTTELTRSNQSLDLLYRSIARLHKAPLAPETYREMLAEMEQVMHLNGGMVCLLPKHGGPARVLASSLPACRERDHGDCPHCARQPDRDEFWQYRLVGGDHMLTVPLRDLDGLYGVLRLTLPASARLQDWQTQLLEALARHIGTALGTSFKTEQERLLALQEERSVIARELHDSIAQSLSYMKIQTSLLQPTLAEPPRLAEARVILNDLREGISAAYRQLRELLATFRLKMEGDFLALLTNTVLEYSHRGGLPIHLETDLAGCHLSPNQEIHTLQVVREALSNVLQHAHARQAWVSLRHAGDGDMIVRIEDDGIGLDNPPATDGAGHYGLAIMRERALTLGGSVATTPREEAGTRVTLRFRAEPVSDPFGAISPISPSTPISTT
jgi:two-component system nitrate/nitrite sensor histidine kinase NarX